MSTVLSFPDKRPAMRAARHSTDEARLNAWYDGLRFDRPRHGIDGWYTLHELRAATGIPMSRLPTALYRNGWITGRKRGYPLLFWHGPSGFDVLEGP